MEKRNGSKLDNKKNKAMKYIIILLVVFIFGSNCIGQKKDSLTIHRVFLDEGHTTFYTQVDFPKDTVRVLMLICDTASVRWVDSGIVNNKLVQIGEPVERYISNKAWWQFGYEVFSIKYATEPNYPLPEHTYLDQNKKPLPKSIVVWITKEIK